MDKTKIKKRFLKYKKIIIQNVGNKAMSDLKINQICSKLFPDNWGGCYAVDDLPIKSYKNTHYFIINTDISSKPGKHWCSVIIYKNICYIWDSFSRNLSKILPILTNRLKKIHIHIIDSNQDGANQRGDSQVCGQLSIAWLCVFNKYGQQSCLV